MTGLRKFIDGIFVGVLLLYALAGLRLAPFHGDESTIIYTAHDWFTFVAQPASQYYTPSPRDPAEQELRLLNGPLTRYAIGAGLTLLGISEDRLNSQWDWGGAWDYNRQTGHYPDEPLLFVGRWVSTCLLMLSIAAVFALTRRLANRQSAYLATLMYTLMPSVLLNGRRAIFESAFLATSTLFLVVGIGLAARIGKSRSLRLWHFVALGVWGGLATAAKHTALISVLPLLLAVLLWVGVRRRAWRLALAGGLGAGVAMAITFGALNPAWWNRPLDMPALVLRLRGQMLQGQADAFGGFGNFGERFGALATGPQGAPQYYEVARGWSDWLAADIAAYERSGLAGIAWGAWLWLMAALGTGWLLRDLGRKSAHAVFLVTAGCTALGILALNPLPWQRYYLPMTVPFAVLVGIGASWIIDMLMRRQGKVEANAR